MLNQYKLNHKYGQGIIFKFRNKTVDFTKYLSREFEESD